jgi:hypothetical protein
MKQYDIKSVSKFHGARNHELPPEPGQPSNTTGGNKSRGSSRGRGAKSGASSREPSSERGERTLAQCVIAKYDLAKKQYKYAKESMATFTREDFRAVAIMLCENGSKMAVLDHVRMHGLPDQKYYEQVKTMFPKFVDTPWEYKPSTPKQGYKYHIDKAIRDMKSGGVDYNNIMSKATMAALAINKSHSTPEVQNMLFQDYIVKHTTPDDRSKELVQNYFSEFSHVQRPPGQRAPSAGHAPRTPAHPRGGGGGGPLVHTVGGDGLHSSFDTQHFGEAVPDEYRV